MSLLMSPTSLHKFSSRIRNSTDSYLWLPFCRTSWRKFGVVHRNNYSKHLNSRAGKESGHFIHSFDFELDNYVAEFFVDPFAICVEHFIICLIVSSFLENFRIVLMVSYCGKPLVHNWKLFESCYSLDRGDFFLVNNRKCHRSLPYLSQVLGYFNLHYRVLYYWVSLFRTSLKKNPCVLV